VEISTKVSEGPVASSADRKDSSAVWVEVPRSHNTLILYIVARMRNLNTQCGKEVGEYTCQEMDTKVWIEELEEALELAETGRHTNQDA
jgi:hypothetical protein